MRRWYLSAGGEWLVEDGDVLDRFAEDYVNDPGMGVEEFVRRLDRYVSRQDQGMLDAIYRTLAR